MPLQATSGAASYDAFGGGVPVVPAYIEEVFSCFLYTGNVTSLNITNGIDLAGKGGLIWTKERNNTATHLWIDSQRGLANGYLRSDTTDAANTSRVSESISSFNADGYTLHAPDTLWDRGSYNYVSWTFRKQPKFFDIVTYTGNGGASQTINHNLGSVPGCMIVKSTSTVENWKVYHRSLGTPAYEYLLNLNTTDSVDFSTSRWASNPTSTTFSVASNTDVNASGVTYVAYLFAHNAGGFGLTGTDNVISCGSYTGNGSSTGPVIDLGYEPQWLLVKEATQSGNAWSLFDNMRGLSVAGPSGHLRPNASDAEDTTSVDVRPTATGFQPITSSGRVNRSGETFIYIAIRRGPMRVPTSGTSVFSPVAQTNSGSQPFPVTAGFPVDSAWFGQRNGWGVNFITSDRLRGATNLLLTTSTNSEADNNSTYGPSVSRLDSNTQFKDGMTNASEPDIYWMFRRAPGYFDEVCYTGNGATQNITHNLGVAPELMVVKKRSVGGTSNWAVYASPLANADAYLFLNDTAAVNTSSVLWNSTAPTSTVFSLGGSTNINQNGETAIAYLFATCAGVSKVGSYTGTATTKQIDCGFTAGARFVLIKRTDSTGDWYVWDTARGIVSGNDPYLLLNSTAAEVTNTDYIDTYSAGFEISSTAPAAINASGGTFIFLAIA
jgi:hypothetical protein